MRGYARCGFHADIFDEVQEEYKINTDLKFKCLGGGRINHKPDKKKIVVYGYSQVSQFS